MGGGLKAAGNSSVCFKVPSKWEIANQHKHLKVLIMVVPTIHG